MNRLNLGSTDLQIPSIVFGSSALGNLFVATPDVDKLEIARQWIEQSNKPIVIDTAGKYGAGLSLEMIGKTLRELNVNSQDVVISNKLGWKRIPLTSEEPTFEPGAWVDLKYDAQQCISYDGILQCWRQGQKLLGEPYQTHLLSVHDPDEYLHGAASIDEREKRLSDIVEAYRALNELKAQGKATAIGIGAKDWQVIKEIESLVELDWVMMANSLTIYRHPPELLEFIENLAERQIGIINSAVFHAGFLVGGSSFDYRQLDPNCVADRPLFEYRDTFLSLCVKHNCKPADVCVQFALSPPGIDSVALNSSKPSRIKDNVNSARVEIPNAFWIEAKTLGLIAKDYPYVG